jgi:hypothetical protein
LVENLIGEANQTYFQTKKIKKKQNKTIEARKAPEILWEIGNVEVSCGL